MEDTEECGGKFPDPAVESFTETATKHPHRDSCSRNLFATDELGTDASDSPARFSTNRILTAIDLPENHVIIPFMFGGICAPMRSDVATSCCTLLFFTSVASVSAG
jgi:hypothetical protein